MSNPSNAFQCRWQPSPWLLRGVLVAALLALAAAFMLDVAGGLRVGLVFAIIAYLGYSLPRHVWLNHPSAVTGLRHADKNWALHSPAHGWQPVRLSRDCIVLPWLVILRYRRQGQWWVRSVCVPGDALSEDAHRQLRVRLRFGRGRFGASQPEA